MTGVVWSLLQEPSCYGISAFSADLVGAIAHCAHSFFGIVAPTLHGDVQKLAKCFGQ
jgi:hypothetical protein